MSSRAPGRTPGAVGRSIESSSASGSVASPANSSSIREAPPPPTGSRCGRIDHRTHAPAGTYSDRALIPALEPLTRMPRSTQPDRDALAP